MIGLLSTIAASGCDGQCQVNPRLVGQKGLQVWDITGVGAHPRNLRVGDRGRSPALSREAASGRWIDRFVLLQRRVCYAKGTKCSVTRFRVFVPPPFEARPHKASRGDGRIAAKHENRSEQLWQLSEEGRPASLFISRMLNKDRSVNN